MECRFDWKKSSRDQQASSGSESEQTSTALPRAIERSNPRIDKRGLSYADMHPELTKAVHPKFVENHPKQWMGRKTNREGELFKYMSKFPGSLEKNGNRQEKAFSVGVRESQHLEKCNHTLREVPKKSVWPYVTRSRTSLSNSTHKSSDPRRGHVPSPACVGMQHPSLEFHLVSSRTEGYSKEGYSKEGYSKEGYSKEGYSKEGYSKEGYSKEGYSKAVKPFGENLRIFQVCKGVQTKTLEEGNPIRANGQSNLSPPGMLQEDKKDLGLKIDQEIRTFQNEVSSEAGSSSLEVKLKPQQNEVLKRREASDNCKLNDRDRVYPFLPPRHLSEKNCLDAPKFQVSSLSPSAVVVGRNFPEHKVDCSTKVGPDLNHACPFPHEVDGNRHPQMKLGSLIHMDRNKRSSERSRSAPRSTEVGSSLSRSGYAEDKIPTLVPKKQQGGEASEIQDFNSIRGASEKSRSISPFRRLSFSIGKTSKSSSTKDFVSLPRSSTATSSAKYAKETAAASTSADGHVSCDKPSVSGRGRSSPLRRLLEPLMKPKAANNSCNILVEPSQSKGSHKLSDGRPCSSNMDKAEFNVTKDAPEDTKSSESSTTQALLRVTVRNDQLMFTFAVEKESEIVAATLKKLSTKEKGDISYIYTFFSVQEVKKKNTGWINQGVKGESKNYVSNLVAQMRISGSQPLDQCTIREFVLFSVNLGPADQQLSDPEPSNELAAIRIKIPRKVGTTKAVYQVDKRGDSQDVLNGSMGATVILPGGVHSLPHRGGPSSLMQRWKSGGSCDCGGWDMGCNLRILTSEHPLSKIAPLNSSSLSDKLELFFQGAPQESQPFFRFAPFKDRIYSVEYNPETLSLLQAFSICIAVWDSQKLCEHSESCLLNLREAILFRSDGLRPNGSEGEAPARYISYPPVSPVGRV